MAAVPITLMQALDGKGRRILGDGDGPTMEDPLAAVVETSSRGHALARDTRLTEVGRECWRRFKIEPPCRLNFEPGLMANL